MPPGDGTHASWACPAEDHPASRQGRSEPVRGLTAQAARAARLLGLRPLRRTWKFAPPVRSSPRHDRRRSGIRTPKGSYSQGCEPMPLVARVRPSLNLRWLSATIRSSGGPCFHPLGDQMGPAWVWRVGQVCSTEHGFGDAIQSAPQASRAAAWLGRRRGAEISQLGRPALGAEQTVALKSASSALSVGPMMGEHGLLGGTWARVQ